MQQERIAKILARSGICSRRDAEKLILDKRIKLNNKVVETLGTKASKDDIILFDNRLVQQQEPTRLWIYNKPRMVITSHKDEQNRRTVFDNLKTRLPRVISIGRLDYNSEGLLLLTNDGEFSRFMEKNSFIRRYKVRVFGDLNRLDIEYIRSGITIDKIHYKKVDIEYERSSGSNSWLIVSLQEGKNREIRKIFEYFGLSVNRLIRISYGIFELSDIKIDQFIEVSEKDIARQLEAL